MSKSRKEIIEERITSLHKQVNIFKQSMEKQAELIRKVSSALEAFTKFLSEDKIPSTTSFIYSIMCNIWVKVNALIGEELDADHIITDHFEYRDEVDQRVRRLYAKDSIQFYFCGINDLLKKKVNNKQEEKLNLMEYSLREAAANLFTNSGALKPKVEEQFQNILRVITPASLLRENEITIFFRALKVASEGEKELGALKLSYNMRYHDVLDIETYATTVTKVNKEDYRIVNLIKAWKRQHAAAVAKTIAAAATTTPTPPTPTTTTPTAATATTTPTTAPHHAANTIATTTGSTSIIDSTPLAIVATKRKTESSPLYFGEDDDTNNSHVQTNKKRRIIESSLHATQEFDNTQEIFNCAQEISTSMDAITTDVMQHFEEVKKNWIDSARKQVQVADDIEQYLQAMCAARKSMASIDVDIRSKKFTDILQRFGPVQLFYQVYCELWLTWTVDALEKEGKVTKQFDRKKALLMLERKDGLWSNLLDYTILHCVDNVTEKEIRALLNKIRLQANRTCLGHAIALWKFIHDSMEKIPDFVEVISCLSSGRSIRSTVERILNTSNDLPISFDEIVSLTAALKNVMDFKSNNPKGSATITFFSEDSSVIEYEKRLTQYFSDWRKIDKSPTTDCKRSRRRKLTSIVKEDRKKLNNVAASAFSNGGSNLQKNTTEEAAETEQEIQKEETVMENCSIVEEYYNRKTTDDDDNNNNDDDDASNLSYSSSAFARVIDKAAATQYTNDIELDNGVHFKVSLLSRQNKQVAEILKKLVPMIDSINAGVVQMEEAIKLVYEWLKTQPVWKLMLCYSGDAKPSALSEQTPSNGLCCFHAFNQILNRSLALLHNKEGKLVLPIKEDFHSFNEDVKVIIDNLVKSIVSIKDILNKSGSDSSKLAKLQVEIDQYIKKCRQIATDSQTAGLDERFQNQRKSWGDSYDGMLYLLYKFHANHDTGLLPSLKFNLFRVMMLPNKNNHMPQLFDIESFSSMPLFLSSSRLDGLSTMDDIKKMCSHDNNLILLNGHFSGLDLGLSVNGINDCNDLDKIGREIVKKVLTDLMTCLKDNNLSQFKDNMVYTPNKSSSRTECIDLNSQKEEAELQQVNTPGILYEHSNNSSSSTNIEDKQLLPLLNTPSPTTTRCYDTDASSLTESKTVAFLPSHITIATLQKIEKLLVETGLEDKDYAAEARSLLSILLDELKRKEW